MKIGIFGNVVFIVLILTLPLFLDTLNVGIIGIIGCLSLGLILTFPSLNRRLIPMLYFFIVVSILIFGGFKNITLPPAVANTLLLIPILVWLTCFNHLLVNYSTINFQRTGIERAYSFLLLKYEPKKDSEILLLVILAFVYLGATLVAVTSFIMIENPLWWVPMVILSLLMSELMLRATQYSKAALFVTIFLGNLFLIMSQLDLPNIDNFWVQLGLSNVGIGFIANATERLQKDSRERRFILGNWMLWCFFFTVLTIIPIYQNAIGVLWDFILKAIQLIEVVFVEMAFSKKTTW